MFKFSVGVLLYWVCVGVVDVFLVYLGGLFWVGKDDGVWLILKGEYIGGEDLWLVVWCEFFEEIGLCVFDGL